MSRTFGAKVWVVAEFERLYAMRLQFVSFPDPLHRRGTDLLRRRHRAHAPLRGVLRRRFYRGLHDSGFPLLGDSFRAPGRGRSSRIPLMPSLSYRFRHNSTVGTDVDSFRARTRLASPSAAPRMILMRRTMPRGALRCCLIAINCFRSASSKASLAAGGSGISTSSIQVSPY